MHEILERTMHHTERARLRKELEEVAFSFAKENPEVLVVLDRSARPLGGPMREILKEAFGIKTKIFFIHPREIALRYYSQVLPSNGNWKQLIHLINLEHPAFVKGVAGKRVVILDDQYNTHWNMHAVEDLVQALGAKKVYGRALSRFDPFDKDVYSWRRNNLHSVEKPQAAGRLFVSKRKELTELEKQELAKLKKRMNERVVPRVIMSIKNKRR